MNMQPRRFARWVVFTLVVPAAVIACAVAGADPYGLWREYVPGRANPPLENRMRFTKSLQVFAQRPDTVFIGSSVVYRGLDPADLADGSVYNLGISSLRIVEAESYVRAILRGQRPKLIVMGVDYFAFDSVIRTEPGFDSTLDRPEYPLKAAFAALLSTHAIKDAWRSVRTGAIDRDGEWRRNGYKATRHRTAAEVEEILRSAEEFFGKARIARSELPALTRIIEMTQREGVRLILFVPPYHSRWIDASEKSRQALGFDAWLAAITEIAKTHGAELWDFARANPWSRGPMGVGSDWYIDASHFSPLMGRWIMQRIGLPLRRQGEEPPAGFGARLS